MSTSIVTVRGLLSGAFTLALLGLAGLPASLWADPLDQWTLRSSATTMTLRAIAYGDNQFVAVGDAGTILTSPDGIVWTKRTSGTAYSLYSVAFGNNRFVAGGGLNLSEDSKGVMLTSPDGATWTPILSSAVKGVLYGICYGNGTFVAVGGIMEGPLQHPDLILASPDGRLWTPQVSPEPVTSLRFTGAILFSVTYAKNTFVAVGSEFFYLRPSWPQYVNNGRILTSPDGLQWRQQAKDGFWLYAVTYGNGLFVTYDVYATLTSPDGRSWTRGPQQSVPTIYGIAYGNGAFAAVGCQGSMLTSFDGNQWSNRVSGTTNALYGITFGNDTFFAVGEAGTILQSAPLPPPPDPALLSGRIIDSAFELTLGGTVGQAYSIQSADDLSESIPWQTLATLTLTNGTATWRDTTAINRSQRYYRAVNSP